MKQQGLFICVADGENYDYNTISTKRKISVERALERANKNYHPLYYQWKHLRSWGYKCVKVSVKIKPSITNMCVGGIIDCPGCKDVDMSKQKFNCAGCSGSGKVTCGKCGGKNCETK